jgi:hypothetical protein
LETPDAFGQYRRYVSDISDPRIVHYLGLIDINKISGQRIEIYGERDKQQGENWDKLTD